MGIWDRAKEKLLPTPQYVNRIHEWAKDEAGVVQWVAGTRSVIMNDTPALGNSKGKPLKVEQTLLAGTRGIVTGVGTDFLVFQPNDVPGPGVRVSKRDVKPIGTPHHGDERIAAAELTREEVDAWADEVKARLGLQVFAVYLQRDGTLKLDTLIVPKGERKQGVGTTAMEELNAFADEHGRRVVLSPAVRDDFQGTTSRSRLVKFYKDRGYKENKGRARDFTMSEGMFRDPRKGCTITAANAGDITVTARDLPSHKQMSWHGMPVSIEALGGEERVMDSNRQWLPEEWVGTGYFDGLEAEDGDSLDVVVGPGSDEDDVFIAAQLDKDDGAFLQYKVFLHFEDEAAAEAAFALLWPAKMFGGIERVPVQAFIDDVLDKLVVEDTSSDVSKTAGADVLRWHKLDIVLEARGGEQRPTGHRQPLPAEWRGVGYFKDLRDKSDADGQEMDVIVGPGDLDGDAHIAIQLDDGAFRQFKTLLGFDSDAEAEAAFRLLWKPETFGGVWSMPSKKFRKLVLPRLTKQSRIAMVTLEVDPWRIEPPHVVKNERKYSELAAAMQESGWNGRPVLVYMSGGAYQAITGSHRIAAAREAGLERVPVLLIENQDFATNALYTLLDDAGDNYGRLRALEKAVKANDAVKPAYELLLEEVALKNGVSRTSARESTLVEKLQSKLTPDLLKKEWRKKHEEGACDPMTGHCYVAAEALFHLLPGSKAQFIRHEGAPHWFVLSPQGEIIDPTASQFKTPVPYDQAKGKGFMTKEPSARARELMNRIKQGTIEISAGLTLQRTGYQRYEGRLDDGRRVTVGCVEQVAHGTFPAGRRQKRERSWSVKVDGVEVGRVASLREARALLSTVGGGDHTPHLAIRSEAAADILITVDDLDRVGAKTDPLGEREMKRWFSGDDTVTLISARETGSSISQAKAQHLPLLQELERMGVDYRQTRGQWYDGVAKVMRPETSLVIHGLSFDDALRLSKKHNQEAFIFKEPGGAALMYEGYRPQDEGGLKAMVPLAEGKPLMGGDALRVGPRAPKGKEDKYVKSRSVSFELPFDWNDPSRFMPWSGSGPITRSEVESHYGQPPRQEAPPAAPGGAPGLEGDEPAGGPDEAAAEGGPGDLGPKGGASHPAATARRHLASRAAADSRRFIVVGEMRSDKSAGESACVVIRVPSALARMWPDDSEPAHFTLAYIKGPFDDNAKARLEEVVAKLASATTAIPVELSRGVSWFTTDKEDEPNREIAHKGVHPKTHLRLEALHWKLLTELEAAGFTPARRDAFKSHATLSYEPVREFDGMVPEGGFTARELELWGWDDDIVFPLQGAMRFGALDIAGAWPKDAPADEQLWQREPGKYDRNVLPAIEKKRFLPATGPEFHDEPAIEEERAPTEVGSGKGQLKMKPNGGYANIMKVMALATPSEVDYWGKWYAFAGNIAREMAGRYGIDVETVAGVIAVLSPGTMWHANVIAAKQVIEFWKAQQEFGPFSDPSLSGVRGPLEVGVQDLEEDEEEEVEEESEQRAASRVAAPFQTAKQPFPSYPEVERILDGGSPGAPDAEMLKDKDVLRLAKSYGLSPESAAAVVAAIMGPNPGPERKAEALKSAREGIKYWRESKAPRADKTPPRKFVEDKKKSKDAPATVFKPIKAPSHPLGQEGPHPGSYPSNIAKAIRILDGEPPEEAVTGPKVSVFYRSLVDPEGTQRAMVLDGHAINIWRGEKRPLKGLKDPTDSEKETMRADYGRVAETWSITTQAVQAITWYIWKTVVNPKAAMIIVGDDMARSAVAIRRRRKGPVQRKKRIYRPTWYRGAGSSVAWSGAYAAGPGAEEVTLSPKAKVLHMSEAELKASGGLRRTAGLEDEAMATMRAQAEAIKELVALLKQTMGGGGYDAVQTEDRLVVLNPRALEAAPTRSRWLKASSMIEVTS